MDVPLHTALAALAAGLTFQLPLRGQIAGCDAEPPALIASADQPVTTLSALTPYAAVTVESWHNRGGLRSGGWWDALLDAGAEVDLGRLGGPSGSTVFFQVHGMLNQRHGADFSSDTGTFNPVSGILAGDHLRVFNFHYRQSWHDEAVTLKLGQLAIDDDFMCSAGAAVFVNSAFGAMPSQVALSLCQECNNGTAFPIYAVASPGCWVRWRPSAACAWQTGLYYGAPGFDEPGNHGFDWQGTSHSGPLVFTEFDWNYGTGAVAGTLRLGVCYHGGRFDDYDALFAGRAGAESRGVAGAYLVNDTTLAADAAGRPALAAFGRVGISPQHDRSIVTTYVDAGLTWQHPLPSRPDDVAGVAVSRTGFGRTYRAYAAPDDPAAAETTVELTYRAQVTDRLAIQPDVQWLFRPARDAGGRRRTATVIGVRAQLSF